MHAQTEQTDLADEELGGLLVLPDLTESDGSRSVPMRLLDSSSGGSTLPGCLGGELLTRSLASGGLAGGLLGTCHFFRFGMLVRDAAARRATTACRGEGRGR
jgi:hypothetical protein